MRRRPEPPPPSNSPLESSLRSFRALGESRVSRRSRRTQARVSLTHGAAGTPGSGEPRAAPPQVLPPASQRRPPSVSFSLGRSIRDRRA
jgi:hypothetical protein